ncbi:MAG: hypothetical protein MJ198_06065 [Bacteroidales bacterium]|nr:hypothetical protein [Bacteroidales bacterium]
MAEEVFIDFNKSRTTREIFSDYWAFIKSVFGKSYVITLGVFVLPFSLIGGYLLTQEDFENPLINLGSFEIYHIHIALLFSLMAKFFGIFLTCIYVNMYMSGEQDEIGYIKRNFKESAFFALSATVFMFMVQFLGLCCFIVPGIMLMAPLSIFVYDAINIKQSFFISLSRCVNLCRTNWKQSFSVVLLCYSAIIITSLFFGQILPEGNTVANLLVSSALTVLSETVMVPFILLYYSLANQNMQL